MAKFAKTDAGFYATIVENEGFGVEDMKAWAEKKINLLEKRKQKDRERAAEKRAIGDEVQAIVLECVTSEPQTVNMILDAALAKGADTTHNKVVNKLANLVDAGKILREDGKVKFEDEEGKVKTKRVKVFRLAE